MYVYIFLLIVLEVHRIRLMNISFILSAILYINSCTNFIKVYAFKYPLLYTVCFLVLYKYVHLNRRRLVLH